MRSYDELYDKLQLEKWYLVEHLTLSEIGEKLGISRQAVFNRIRRCRIDVSTAERFKVLCDICGKEYETTRKRWRISYKHFCSMGCSGKYKSNPEYRQWRNGQRIGRLVMESVLERPLRDGEVVHHRDGNNGNNDKGNLMLFSSNSEHMKFHHAERRERLLQG